MYQVEQNASDSSSAIRRTVKGEVRPVDSQDECFMAFAAAVQSTQAHPLVRRNPWLPPFDVLFETEDELVQYCKENVVRLVVRQEGTATRGLAHGRHLEAPGGAGGIFSLMTATSPWSASSAANEVDGLVGEDSSVWVSEALDQRLAQELGDEASNVRRLSNWPIRRAFVYADISDFSKFRAGQQSLMVSAFSRIARQPGFWEGDPFADRVLSDLEAMLCIGDGYIFVFKDSAHAAYFAAHFASLIELLVAKTIVPVEIHFRMGVHVGPVYCFWDPGRNDWNYTGEGINGGQRVLSVIGRDTDDVVFISSRVRQDLIASSDTSGPAHVILLNAENRGRRQDKHGNSWRVYELNHANLISSSLQPAREYLRNPTAGSTPGRPGT